MFSWHGRLDGAHKVCAVNNISARPHAQIAGQQFGQIALGHGQGHMLTTCSILKILEFSGNVDVAALDMHSLKAWQGSEMHNGLITTCSVPTSPGNRSTPPREAGCYRSTYTGCMLPSRLSRT